VNQLQKSAGEVERALSLPYAGAAWAALEIKTSALIRKAVRVTELERQTEQARSILRVLQGRLPNFRGQTELILPPGQHDHSPV
jgi:hypothetical protein